MNVVAIIQARMGSTRLPGKVLLHLSGEPVLQHVVSRISACKQVHTIVVATSVDPADDLIEEWCHMNKVLCFRGSHDNVLDRYYKAAQKYGADIIVRITADCPVIDPTIVDDIVKSFKDSEVDFCFLAGEFPDGLDCAAFSFLAIKQACRDAKLPSEREHVAPYIVKNPQLFATKSVEKFSGLSHMRWTLDEPRDFIFLQEVYSRLYSKGRLFLTQDILKLLELNLDILELNNDIPRNEGYSKSLEFEEAPYV